MSGELTQYGANRAVQAGVGQEVAAAAAMYLGLATSLPATPDVASFAAYGSVEVTTAGYTRQAVIWGAPSGDPSSVASGSALTFGPFTADPPNVTHCFLCDTSIGTGGYVLAYWELTAPKDAGDGDSLIIGIGDLTMSVD